jgi:hypothetical protein
VSTSASAANDADPRVVGAAVGVIPALARTLSVAVVRGLCPRSLPAGRTIHHPLAARLGAAGEQGSTARLQAVRAA